MTRTTIVAPPDAIVRRKVEDDAGSTSSAATSAVVSLYDEEIWKMEAIINRKLKELTLLKQMREEKAAEDRSQQVSDVEDGDQEPDDMINPDFLFEDPSAITGETKGVHFVPTPHQMPRWKSRVQRPSEPPLQPPMTSTPVYGWRQQPPQQKNLAVAAGLNAAKDGNPVGNSAPYDDDHYPKGAAGETSLRKAADDDLGIRGTADDDPWNQGAAGAKPHYRPTPLTRKSLWRSWETEQKNVWCGPPSRTNAEEI